MTTLRESLAAFGVATDPNDTRFDVEVTGDLDAVYERQANLIRRMKVCFRGISHDHQLGILVGWLGLDGLESMVKFLEKGR